MSWNIGKRRRGFALALCFVSMLVISLLSTAIMLSLTAQKSAVNAEIALADRRFAISQIGEDFLRGEVVDGAVVGEYTCRVSHQVLTVKNSSGSTVLLVEKDPAGRILRWHTTDPGEGST